MDDVYENIGDYNLRTKRKVLIIFDDMQKIKYSSCFYHSILFFCPKRCKIEFNALFSYEINNKRGLQYIAISQSAGFDYKYIMKIYRECIKEPHSFLTIDTTLPVSNSL